jgi:hypothetical protein
MKKKFLEIGIVITITLSLLLPAAALQAKTTEDQPLKTILSNSNYIPQLQGNIFEENWIHFDDGTNVNAIGLTNGGTWEGAIRITPTELIEYDGYEITAVRWHHGQEPFPEPEHSGNIKVYDAGTATNPGSLITSEPFTVPSVGWFEIPLSNPVQIDIDKDVWVSIQVTHAPGETPLGVGPGPHIAGKSDWVYYAGSWGSLYDETSGALDYNWNIWVKVEESSRPPEKPQTPEGPTVGNVDFEYMFSTYTTDPDGDQVYYQWDWDDETSTEWLGPFDSGVSVVANHAWTEKGNYEIKVKAKDVNGVESDWSDPLTVIIVDEPILEIGNITGGVLKVRAVIKNTGSTDALSVKWSISLNGGFILLGKNTTGRVLNIPAGGEVTVTSDAIFGLGNTMVTVTAENPDVPLDTKEQEAFVLLFLIKI